MTIAYRSDEGTYALSYESKTNRLEDDTSEPRPIELIIRQFVRRVDQSFKWWQTRQALLARHDGLTITV